MKSAHNTLQFIITRLLLLVLLAVPALLVSLQIPAVQTALAHKVLDRLHDSLNGRISAASVRIQADGTILVKDLLILDEHPYTEDIYNYGWAPVDTVAYVRSASARLKLSTLLGGKCLNISRATVEDGIFHLTTEPGMRQNLMRVFGMEPPEELPVPTDGPAVFSIGRVRARNFRFRLNNFEYNPFQYTGFGLNYCDLDATAEIAEGRNLRMDGSVISGICDHAVITEKSGYRINHVQGKVRAGMGKVIVQDIILLDPWSRLDLTHYGMHFRDARSFIRYVEEVRMTGEFNPSTLAMKTVSYFAGAPLKDNGLIFDIQSGEMDGTVSDFSIKNFRFKEITSGVSGTIYGRSRGIPDPMAMRFDVNAEGLAFTTSQLSSFLSEWAGTRIDFGSLAAGRKFVLDGRIDGLLDKMHFRGHLHSSCGSISFEGRMADLMNQNRPVGMSAGIDSKSLRMGDLMGIKDLGETSFSAGAEALFAGDGLSLRLDSLHIRNAEFNGHRYEGISASGRMNGSSATLSLKSSDPACRLSLEADADLKKNDDGIAHYRVISSVENVDLAQLNLIKGREKSAVRMTVALDAVNSPSGLFSGNARISGLKYEGSGTERELGDIGLSASESGGMQLYTLVSDFLTASYTASRQPARLVHDLQSASTRAQLPALYPDADEACKCGSYSLDMKVGDVSRLLSIFAHGLYVEKGSEVSLRLTPDGNLNADVVSGRIAIGPNFLKDVNIGIDNRNSVLSASLNAGELKAGGFSFSCPELTASADSNRIRTHIGLQKGEGSGIAADINLAAVLSRRIDGSIDIEARPLKSRIDTDGQIWKMSPSTIMIRDKSISVNGFRLASGEQRIDVNGEYSPGRSDTLRVDVHRLGLGIADSFVKENFGLEGRADGRALIVSNEDRQMLLFMNMLMDSVRIGGTEAGQLHLRSVWDKDNDRLSLLARNTIGDRRALQMLGHYTPKDKSLRVNASVDSLDLGIAAPFLRSLLSETGGSISGEFSASGRLDSLSLSSSGAQLNDALVRIAYTGVPYIIRGPFSLDNEGLSFDDIRIRDDRDGSARLRGSLKHSSFRDMSLDARLSIADIRVLDMPESPDGSFYGQLSASGSASISGPLDALTIEGDISTSGDGELHVPLSGSLSGSSGNLLTYTDHNVSDDPYDIILREYLTEKKSSSSDMTIKAKVGINPGVNAFMEIDKDNGNVVTFNGQGQASLDIRPSQSQFNVRGDYSIMQGKYHFVIPGIMEKDLNIENNSSIAFGGDLMDTRLDITAGYHLKAPLSSLLTDVSGVGTRRNVECGMTIGDKLRNPKLDFFINIPDLDPTLQSEVDAALNTDDKIQKQFVALLLMGSFLPSEESGVFNGTNMLYSNLTEVVSSQMSNILKKLDIPLDFGFRFQESNTGNNVFDVALSTQLFNNRVLVSGSVGNRQYKPSSSSVSDVVGDIDIQVKLNKTGRFRLNMFSHSADERSSFLDYSQRNGVGLSFQKEFKAKKTRKNRRKEIIIRIDNESGKAISDTVTFRRKRSR